MRLGAIAFCVLFMTGLLSCNFALGSERPLVPGAVSAACFLGLVVWGVFALGLSRMRFDRKL
jgi:hypothetical protein